MPKLQHASIAIEGMNCAACTTAIENKLKSDLGVREAKVYFEQGTAEVDYETGSASVAQLEEAIQDSEYRVLSKASSQAESLMRKILTVLMNLLPTSRRTFDLEL